MSVNLTRTGKSIKINQSTQLLANERETLDTAYAGDVIGIYDTGNYQIGDTLTTKKEPIFFEPMPTFPPELFALVSPVNSMKAKHFQKGVMQLAQEGAVQVYHTKYNEIIIGAVGALQFEVFEYRLTNEYNSNIRMENLDFSIACWIKNTDIEYVENNLDSRIKLVFDHFERPILLFPNSFTLNYFTQKHKDIELVEALSVNSTFNGE